MKRRILVLAGAIALSACSEQQAANDAAIANNMGASSENVSEDPFGATGAPGADLTDNGATDASNGFAENVADNAAE